VTDISRFPQPIASALVVVNPPMNHDGDPNFFEVRGGISTLAQTFQTCGRPIVGVSFDPRNEDFTSGVVLGPKDAFLKGEAGEPLEREGLARIFSQRSNVTYFISGHGSSLLDVIGAIDDVTCRYREAYVIEDAVHGLTDDVRESIKSVGADVHLISLPQALRMLLSGDKAVKKTLASKEESAIYTRNIQDPNDFGCSVI
jgi:hypothetical protein